MCSAPVCTYSNLSQTPDKAVACPACQTKNVADADHSLRVLFSLNRAVRDINLAVPKLEVPEGVVEGDIPGYLNTLKPEEKIVIEEFLRLIAEHAPITALDLMHIQLFRDFFKDQVLPVHVSLKVTRVALVFTDLRGSTAMYAAKGDPLAYNLVRQHFDLLAQVTVQNGGVIIKTIGDAVMASFKHEVDAVRAAADFHKAIAAFNLAEGLSKKDALILKVGVHAGPCLSVNQNDLMDYFGTTVNMAARIAALSKGGDIIMSKELLEDKEVSEVLAVAGFTLRDTASVTLRGMPQATEVCQLVAIDSPHIIENFNPRRLGQTTV
jgi:class 3 adenylate cyclase